MHVEFDRDVYCSIHVCHVKMCSLGMYVQKTCWRANAVPDSERAKICAASERFVGMLTSEREEIESGGGCAE